MSYTASKKICETSSGRKFSIQEIYRRGCTHSNIRASIFVHVHPGALMAWRIPLAYINVPRKEDVRDQEEARIAVRLLCGIARIQAERG